jgi:hypothetical protein
MACGQYAPTCWVPRGPRVTRTLGHSNLRLFLQRCQSGNSSSADPALATVAKELGISYENVPAQALYS